MFVTSNNIRIGIHGNIGGTSGEGGAGAGVGTSICLCACGCDCRHQAINGSCVRHQIITIVQIADANRIRCE